MKSPEALTSGGFCRRMRTAIFFPYLASQALRGFRSAEQILLRGCICVASSYLGIFSMEKALLEAQ